MLVATALLVVCELKAARKYAVTANALDAASIAILFATFYAARALWDLIPASVTFGLLILVTVLAVMLSIRHDSRFIAVLGLLGGFATPALLSTGENRPIPLFTYLLLLNAGLAWVAFKKGWPLLTILTLILTVVYQWGWVVQYLDTSQLPLAIGIFLVFSVMSFVALILGRRGLERGDASVETGLVLERTGTAAALMPLLFAVYLASVPRLAVDPALLFGFLLRARRRPARDRGRAPRGADAHDRRTRHAARVRHLARQVPERLADDGHALHRGLSCCSMPSHR